MKYILYRTRRNKKCKECFSFSLRRFKNITKIILFLHKYVDGKSTEKIYDNMTDIIISFKYNLLKNNYKVYDSKIIHILYDIKDLAYKYKNCYFVSNYNLSVKDDVWILSDDEYEQKPINYIKDSKISLSPNIKKSISLPNMKKSSIKINILEDNKSNTYIDFLYNIYMMIINYIFNK